MVCNWFTPLSFCLSHYSINIILIHAKTSNFLKFGKIADSMIACRISQEGFKLSH